MKKKLSLDQLKVKSFITTVEGSDKVKSGTDLTGLVGCGSEIPLTGDLCLDTDTTPACQSNPCTDTRHKSRRCVVGTFDCPPSVNCNLSLNLAECWL